MDESQMAKVVEAVRLFAQKFLGAVSELGLEEFEREGDLWRVTFGYRPGWVEPQRAEGVSPLRDLQVPRREYRVFLVNGSGEVVAMKRPESLAA
jgi:hypothetical protein